MNKKVAIRLIGGLFAIAALFLGYRWFQSWSIDPALEEKVDTEEMIAALETTPRGSRLVAFTREGQKIESAGWKEGKDDRDLSWSPLGNHVYFSSNRETDAYNIYRWQPRSNSIDRRSLGSRSQNTPDFPHFAPKDAVRQGLVAAGPTVLQFDPSRKTMLQVLPPLGREITTGEEGGADSQLAGLYSRIGSSFKEAKWAGPNGPIIAVMRSEVGEVLVINPLVAAAGKAPRPQPLYAGERVQFDVDSQGNTLVTILGFRFFDPENIPAEFLKNGKPAPPFKNALIVIPFSETGNVQPMVLSASQDDSGAFWDPALSPDGKFFAIIAGTRKDGIQKPANLLVVNPSVNDPSGTTVVASGDVAQPAWHPSGTKLVFLRREAGGRVIYAVSADGTGERRVSEPGQDYRSPRFSPMTSGS